MQRGAKQVTQAFVARKGRPVGARRKAREEAETAAEAAGRPGKERKGWWKQLEG